MAKKKIRELLETGSTVPASAEKSFVPSEEVRAKRFKEMTEGTEDISDTTIGQIQSAIRENSPAFIKEMVPDPKKSPTLQKGAMPEPKGLDLLPLGQLQKLARHAQRILKEEGKVFKINDKTFNSEIGLRKLLSKGEVSPTGSSIGKPEKLVGRGPDTIEYTGRTLYYGSNPVQEVIRKKSP